MRFTARVSRYLTATMIAVAAPSVFAQVIPSDAIPIYRSAFDAAHNGDWQRARALADRGGVPAMVNAIEWQRLSDRDSGATLPEFQAFVDAHPDWDGIGSIGRNAERAMTEQTPGFQILRWFKSHEPVTTQGSIELVRALLESGEHGRAAALARQTWLENDFSEEQEDDFLRRYQHFLRAGDHEARIDKLIWKGWYTAARRMLPRVDPKTRALADARLRLALGQRGIDEAIQRIPSNLINDEGLVYERVRWHRRGDRNDAAFALLAQAPPASEATADKWWTERNLISRRLLRRGRIDDAYLIAANHGQTSGRAFAEGEWLAGWIAFRFLDNPEEGYDHFNRLYAGVTTPISLARGAYWAGRTSEALGNPDAAQDWYAEAARYVGTYYGQLAAARLPPRLRPRFRIPPTVDPATSRAFETRELVRAAKGLYAVGETESLGELLRHMERKADDGDELVLVASLALALDRPDVAVRACRHAYAEGLPLYPMGYPTVSVADVGTMEPSLVQALIRQESGFMPRAISHAGARGLMQLMPGTAKHTARNAGMAYSTRRLLDDPNYNTALGQIHFGELLDEFGDSYVLALAGYNAGKYRTVEWLETIGDPRRPSVDVVDWVEAIPFSETRNYVQRVLENLQVYRWLMAGTQLAARPHDSSYESVPLAAN